MPVSSVTGSNGISQQQNIQRANERLQLAVASLVSGKRVNRAADDVAALSIATQLQSQLSGLKEVSGNAAQAASLLEVADGGAGRITELLQDLREVAIQARSPTLNPSNREALNEQFRELTREIDRIAENTRFGDKRLLDGSVSGEAALSIGSVLSNPEAAEAAASLDIDDLRASALFDGQSLDVLSADGAIRAQEAIETAIGRAGSARAEIGAFRQSINFLAASIDSAIANQDAARSVFEDADVAEGSTIYSLLNLQRESGLSLSAQTNRLPAGLLRLIE